MIKNRTEAGRLLAEKLKNLESNVMVLAVPRGGIIVGHEIAKKLGCVLDVVISKKITPPDNPEFAIGAITHEGTLFQSMNWEAYSKHPYFEDELNKKKNEVRRRLENYRGSSEYQFDNKIVILVDDGIATGATIFAILNWLKKQKVKQIILAVPVIPSDTYRILQDYLKTIIVLDIPHNFSAVGQFYDEFSQVSDQEVVSILKQYQ